MPSLELKINIRQVSSGATVINVTDEHGLLHVTAGTSMSANKVRKLMLDKMTDFVFNVLVKDNGDNSEYEDDE